ncbi:hypothetical protein [Cohnella sp. WQ 127256]|uniref:hypothetical protein n=1 Tax=Cohnella sp. WQ 127256 TaxID=2938790 RepID=UPI002118A68F|nr:hypothetical protein [Cohnella sp. WQ 127256]
MPHKSAVAAMIIVSALILILFPRIPTTKQIALTSQVALAKQGERVVDAIVPIAVEGKPALDVDKSLFPPLKVSAISKDRGFQLQFDKEQYARLVGTVSTPTRVIHSYVRNDYKEDGTSDTWTRYDAVVVNPDTRDIKVYPMYELKSLEPSFGNSSLFTLIDDRNVMFIRPTLDVKMMSYDLVRLDIETGKIAVIAPRIWEVDTYNGDSSDDFMLGAHYSKQTDSSYGKLLLTSFKGRLWQIDVASGEVQTNGTNTFPAYGDPGSKPPRELIYPSSDLTRFVYQHWGANRFDIIDPTLNKPIHQIRFEDTVALMDPGIVWSPNSQMFFMEYGNRDQALGSYTDNGMLLFAQGIRFYDRDGQVLRTLELPSSKQKRMNVYGWADEGKVWIEYFQAVSVEEGEPLKKEVSYKLYDIRTGKLTDYRITDDFSRLQKISVVKRHKGYSFRSLPYLMVDTTNHLLWLPPSNATAMWDDEQLYMQLSGEDSSYLHSWNPAKRSWDWVHSDPGENINGFHHFTVPTLVQNQWLLYQRYSDQNIDYVTMKERVERNADGLPVLVGEIAKQKGRQDWWEDERKFDVLNATTLRASGISRYGNLKVKSQPGELRHIEDAGPYYYGTYRVEYTNLRGDKKQLQPLIDVTLRQDSPSIMRKYEFDGYDIFLFLKDSYRFSKGYDGGTREMLAYAITKQGESFPLEFQYIHDAKGLQRSLVLEFNDNVPIERDGANLIVQTFMDHRNNKLIVRPSLEKRALIVVDAGDRSAEYEQLVKITSRYSNRIEQALGLEEINLPDGKMDLKPLRALFTDQAWNNPGFQHLKKDFATSKQKGNSSRAFAWEPVDAQFVSPDTIRFTFTLNLWYAIGLAAHLEVGLKLVDGKWMIYDLGSLETEKLEGFPGYNGLIIRDPLELTN